jgi:hypothetical protein
MLQRASADVDASASSSALGADTGEGHNAQALLSELSKAVDVLSKGVREDVVTVPYEVRSAVEWGRRPGVSGSKKVRAAGSASKSAQDLHRLRGALQVLFDAYSEDFTRQVIQRLEARADDLRGQRARLSSETAAARAATAAADAAARAADERLLRLEATCAQARRRKEGVVAELQAAVAEAERAQAELREVTSAPRR